MWKRTAALAMLVLLTAACGSPGAPIPDEEAEKVDVLPGIAADLSATIHETARQELSRGEGGYFLLQFSDSLGQDARALMESTGVVFHDYMPNYAYYAYLPASSLATLEDLLEAGTLRYVGPIPAEAKLEPELAEKALADPTGRYQVVVQFFEEPSPSGIVKVEQWLEITGYSFGPVNLAEGVVTGEELTEILALPFVKWVEERRTADLGG